MNNQLYSVVEHFYPSGILYCHYHTDYFSHGHAFWNYPSGMRMAEGFFNQGVRSGRWRWFSEIGEVLKIIEFGDSEYQKPLVPEPFDFTTCSPGNTILLNEEWEFRQWFWMPDRPIEKILQWWSELDSVSPLSPSKLPGIVVEAGDDQISDWYSRLKSGHYYSCHLHEDEDSWFVKLSGERIFHKNYELVKREGVS